MAGRKSAIDAVDELLRMPDEMKEEQGLDDDVKALKAAWLNETFAPEILEYKKNLVDDLLEIVAHQQEMIDQAMTDKDNRFMVNLCEMEVERVRYMLTEYLRARLHKIQKYHQFILSSEEQKALLSEKELCFLKEYNKAVTGHLNSTVLEHLPEGFRGLLDENGEQPPMRTPAHPLPTYPLVRKPNQDGFVTIKVLDDIGDFQIDEDDVDDVETLNQNDQFVLPYRVIRGLLRKGRLALI